MPFTALTPITPVGPYPAGGTVSAGALAAAFTACDASNGNSFPLTGHEVLELRNTDTGAHTVTINSAPDQEGRTEDITSYSIPATSDVAFSFLAGAAGWVQSDWTLHFTANSALVFARVLICKR
jgi:hypothetical protein